MKNRSWVEDNAIEDSDITDLVGLLEHLERCYEKITEYEDEIYDLENQIDDLRWEVTALKEDIALAFHDEDL